MLSGAVARQRSNGTFGTPCHVERVAAVLIAKRSLKDCGSANLHDTVQAQWGQCEAGI